MHDHIIVFLAVPVIFIVFMTMAMLVSLLDSSDPNQREEDKYDINSIHYFQARQERLEKEALEEMVRERLDAR